MTTELDKAFDSPIQWYPGHIAKLQRELKQKLGLVDVAIVVLDARLPFTTLDKEALKGVFDSNKPLLLVLNKCDLADPKHYPLAEKHLKTEGFPIITLTTKVSGFKKQVLGQLKQLGQPLWQKQQAKGLKPRPLRVGVFGMPNVGKSSLMNGLSGQKKCQTGNKAGVTKHTQWVKLAEGFELMDSPGLIAPKLQSDDQGLLLACIDAIGEKAYETDKVARFLIEHLENLYPNLLKQFYKCQLELTLENLALAQNLLEDKEYPDVHRMGNRLLKDFADGRLGKLSLEKQ